MGDTSKWSGGVLPQNGDDLVFTFGTGNGNTVYSFLDYSALSLNSLICNATGAGPVAPIGNLLTLGAGGITVNAGASTLNLGAALSLSANQTWTNSSGNTATVSGTVFNGGNTLTVGGTGNFTISAPIVGTGGIVKNGTGNTAVTMNGVNTVVMSANYGYSLHDFNGGFTLNRGYLNLGPMSSVGMNPVIAGPLGTGTFSINGGVINSATGGGLLLANINNPITVGGNFLMDVAQGVALNGDVNLGNANRVIRLTNNSVVLNGKISGSGSNAALTMNWAGYGSTTAGSLTLNNPENDFAGGVTVNRLGRLVVGASGDPGLSSSPLGTGTLTMAHQSFLNWAAAPNVTIFNPITLGGDLFTGPGGGGFINLAGPITLAANANGHTVYMAGGNLPTLMSGNISGSGGLGFVFNSGAGAGSASIIISGNNSFTGPTSIRETTCNGRPTIYLDYSANNGNKLDPSSPLNLYVGTNQLIFQGNASAATNQTINGINLDYGAHNLTFTRAGTQAFNANLGDISRANGASINFTLPASGNITVANTATNGILDPWITVNSYFFAAVNGSGNLSVAANNGALPTSGGDSTFNYSSTANTTLVGNVAANSWIANRATTGGLVLDMAGNSLNLTSGGLFAVNWGLTVNDSVGGATIGSGTGELVIRAAGSTVINASIADGTTTLTKFGGGRADLERLPRSAQHHQY